MQRTKRTPAYRQRKGYTQAIVTLTDSTTRQRKDYWLGEHGSVESRERYHRVIAEWEARGRRLPPPTFDAPQQTTGPKLVVVMRDFYLWAKQTYDAGELRSFLALIDLTRKYDGRTAASAFGPKKLRSLREEMVRGDATTDPPRKPWSRRYVNQQVQRLRRVFKWAAGQEILPASVYESLRAVEPLKRGQTVARETAKVGPVPDHLLQATLPHLNRQVRAAVELQLLTGARPNEILSMRPCDIDMTDGGDVWTYRPQSHKNAHRNQDRVIYLGPRAQEILRSFLADRPTTAFLFSPAEAIAERRAAASAARKTPTTQGNVPGTNRAAEPRKQPGERYTPTSYLRSIQVACERAFPLPNRLALRKGEDTLGWQQRLTGAQQQDATAWRRDHRWTQYQLRHNAATEIRRAFGLEAAQLALGHTSALVTDAVYAERDQTRLRETMRKMG